MSGVRSLMAWTCKYALEAHLEQHKTMISRYLSSPHCTVCRISQVILQVLSQPDCFPYHLFAKCLLLQLQHSLVFLSLRGQLLCQVPTVVVVVFQCEDNARLKTHTAIRTHKHPQNKSRRFLSTSRILGDGRIRRLRIQKGAIPSQLPLVPADRS